MTALSRALSALASQAEWRAASAGAELRELGRQQARQSEILAMEMGRSQALRTELANLTKRANGFNPALLSFLGKQWISQAAVVDRLRTELDALDAALEAKQQQVASARHLADGLERRAGVERRCGESQRASQAFALVDDMWLQRGQGARNVN